ncbi:MAG: DUF2225 domain-containing protein [Promethearchaeota archaeon]
MTTFYSITLICPVCKAEFRSSIIGSCGYASKRTDFRPNYWGFNPVQFFYHLCPDCGFCANKKTFENKIENSAFQEEIFSIGPLINLTLEKKLERAMLCIETMNDFGILSLNEYQLANYWIEAFWWAVNPDLINKCGKITLKYFKLALEKNIIPDDQIYIIKYLMAELYRRIGQKSKAIELFNEVILLTKDLSDVKWIYDLAIQQKNNPKENLEKSPKIIINS